jgi:predicted Rossmann fold flavoprotein
MAAVHAAQLHKDVVLIERNDRIGNKLRLSGKGRCNITNAAPIETFIEKFGRKGRFLRTAFYAFCNEDVIEFFEAKGLACKTERQNRVFPVTDTSGSVIDALNHYLDAYNVTKLFHKRVRDIQKEGKLFHVFFEGHGDIRARTVIVATGGASYTKTGSTGDGYRIARRFGHTIIPLTPALVPLKTRERWVGDVQGLTLKNIRLTFTCGKKRIVSHVGELLFTHFGVSGPLVMDLSSDVITLKRQGDTSLSIDLKPGINKAQLEHRLLRELSTHGKKQLGNVVTSLLPSRLIPVILRLIHLDPTLKASQVTQRQRRSLVDILKGLPLTIVGALPLEQAMVTAGGISTKEIDPRTMESKIVPGLYFAGEIIDCAAPSGGYNLQQAFSTGYLAGEKAACVT